MSYLNKVNKNLTLRKFELNKILLIKGFPIGSAGKEFTCNIGDLGDMGSIPGSGRAPRGGHDNPHRYSWWENAMERRLAGYGPRDCRVRHDWSDWAHHRAHMPDTMLSILQIFSF